MFLEKEEIYSFKEFNYYSKLNNSEKIIYDFTKGLDSIQCKLIKHQKVYKTIVLSCAIFLSLEKAANAVPSTGYTQIDTGAWKIVNIFQACIFWIAMLYSLKSLAMLAINGEGNFKKVAVGFLICIGDYMIPWLFGMVPTLFQF